MLDVECFFGAALERRVVLETQTLMPDDECRLWAALGRLGPLATQRLMLDVEGFFGIALGRCVLLEAQRLMLDDECLLWAALGRIGPAQRLQSESNAFFGTALGRLVFLEWVCYRASWLVHAASLPRPSLYIAILDGSEVEVSATKKAKRRQSKGKSQQPETRANFP